MATLDRTKADVYGCLLMTLQDGEHSPRWWPNKPIESMFTDRSDDNQLPHSSVLMRTSVCRAAGNYNERAVGLGADDYHLWYRIRKAGGRFVRDDAVRNVVYRIHEKNSLRIRRARYGGQVDTGSAKGKWVAGAAAAASVALWASPNLDPAKAAPPSGEQDRVTQADKPVESKTSAPAKKDEKRSQAPQGPTTPDLPPPHS